MSVLAALSRYFIAIAMMVFGLQQIIYGDFVTRFILKLPPAVASQRLWAYVTGALLLACGAALFTRKLAAPSALLLAVIGLASFALLYLPALAATPRNPALWTNAGKCLMLSGGLLSITGSLAKPSASRRAMLFAGTLFLSSFLILAGIQHFLYAPFVASLVPTWIPRHLFWTYLAGVALIAGGVGMLLPRTRLPAALLSGLMVFLWVFLLHLPRAVAALHESNETTAVFEALAVTGTAWLVAATTNIPPRFRGFQGKNRSR